MAPSPLFRIHLHDYGIDGSQYFQGHSACRGFDSVVGCGDTIGDAVDDALDSVAQSDVDTTEAEAVLLKDANLTAWPDEPSASEECEKAAREAAEEDPEIDPDNLDGCELQYFVGICYCTGTEGIGGRFVPPDDYEPDPEPQPVDLSAELGRYVDYPEDDERPDLPGQGLLPFNEARGAHPYYDYFRRCIRDGRICPKCLYFFEKTTIGGIGDRQVPSIRCGCDEDGTLHAHGIKPGMRVLFRYTFHEDPNTTMPELRERHLQTVTVIDGPILRDDEGVGMDDTMPFEYKIRFDDGHESSAFEDELGEDGQFYE
jgi:hypothetical protein